MCFSTLIPNSFLNGSIQHTDHESQDAIYALLPYAPAMLAFIGIVAAVFYNKISISIKEGSVLNRNMSSMYANTANNSAQATQSPVTEHRGPRQS